MLHKGRRCLGGNDMGKAGILFALVTGIGTAVVFQDLLRLRDNNQFPANQLLSNKLECTTALVNLDSGKSITISSTGRFFASSSMVLFFFLA